MRFTLEFWQQFGPLSRQREVDHEDILEDRDFIAHRWMDKVEALKNDFKQCDVELPKLKGDDITKAENRKLIQLRRLHAYWALITPEIIPLIIDTLGADSKRFMLCLCVQISTKMIQTYSRGPEEDPRPIFSFARISKGRL